jgi:alpha,alpha-trehalase
MTVTEYIKTNWPKCIRENKQDEGSLIGLPYPYTVPSISGAFQEMYYWDTYFINRGLILIGLTNQAINNTENMFSLIERYGFMPNGNRTGYLKNTQPPFLSEMVKDIYNETGDKEWLKRAVTYLIKEYDFWDKNRNTEVKLSQYKGNIAEIDLVARANGFIRRIKNQPQGYTDEQLGIQYVIACESGWDISPRFGFEAENFVQVDLNSLLCAMERNIAYFLSELNEDNTVWTERHEKRLKLLQKHMKCDGVFYDYNFKTDKTISMFYRFFLYLFTTLCIAK